MRDPARERTDGTVCPQCRLPLSWRPYPAGEAAACRCGAAYTRPRPRGFWGVLAGWLLGPACVLLVSVWR